MRHRDAGVSRDTSTSTSTRASIRRDQDDPDPGRRAERWVEKNAARCRADPAAPRTATRHGLHAVPLDHEPARTGDPPSNLHAPASGSPTAQVAAPAVHRSVLVRSDRPDPPDPTVGHRRLVEIKPIAGETRDAQGAPGRRRPRCSRSTTVRASSPPQSARCRRHFRRSVIDRAADPRADGQAVGLATFDFDRLGRESHGTSSGRSARRCGADTVAVRGWS